MIIGEAREKYSTVAGPGGGTTLNGAQMKAEAKEGFAELIDELKRYVDWSQPLTWIQG
jgi:GTPase involved in cell partitioning and DNA repair